MNTRTMLTLGLSALVIGPTMVGCTSTKGPLEMASARATDLERRADDAARDAVKALGSKRAADAVAHAEVAVGLDPRDGGHRVLLGKAYLAAGRFRSAEQAFGDALILVPGDGSAGLNLALAQTARGDWIAARTTLSTHANAINPADLGLAIALAGDPAGGILILGDAARAHSTSAKVRQNLALSLALAGKWQEAKAVAAVDLAPAEVDRRMLQWAAFTQPRQSSDQVAALLGVVPSADGGQPAQLALAAPIAEPVATADSGALDANMPGPVEGAVAGPIDAKVETVEAAMPATPRFASRGEIVQALPSGYAPATMAVTAILSQPTIAAKPAPKPTVKAAVTADRAPARGGYFVQLGAYDSVAVAKDAWSRLSRRVPTLASMAPLGMVATTEAGNFYRVSVGGFARSDADRVCRQVRARGGSCFVRTGAGERMAAWTRGPQVASR